MESAYFRNLALFQEPAIIVSATLSANAAAETLFAHDPRARHGCLEAAASSRYARVAREAIIADLPMVFFPIFDEDGLIDAVAGMAGNFADIPRLLHKLQKGFTRLNGVLQQAPTMVLTARPNGKIDYISRSWYEITDPRSHGLGAEESLRAAMSNGDYHFFSIGWVSAIAQGREFTLQIRATTIFGVHAFEIRARPIRLKRGPVLKWVGSVVDIERLTALTVDLSRQKRRLEILAEAGAALATAHTPEGLAKALREIPAPRNEQTWFVELRQPRNGETVTAHNLMHAEREAVAAAAAASKGSFLSTLDAPNGAAYTIASIRVDGHAETLGFIGLVDHSGARVDGDAEFVGEIARRAALSIERILLGIRDHELAHMLQRSMLPLALPYTPGMRLDVAYEPAEREALVGGDWYDAFELPDGLIGVAIGDVAGHGFEAAIVMNQVRQSMRAAAMEDYDPASVLARVNRMVTTQKQPMVTTLFAVLDPVTLTCTVASAGHLPPVLVGADGVVRQVQCEGTPLGIAEDLFCANVIEELPPGGALVLYTDGVVEDSRDFVSGEHALLEALANWARFGFAMRAAELQTRLRTGSHQDDAAMFILRFPHVDDFEIRLPATPQNAQRMRLAARRFVAGSPFEEDRAFDAVLAIGEAVNNAVEHAYKDGEAGFVTLSLKRETQRLLVDVRDDGVWREPQAVDRMHGLGIIEHLVDEHEVRKTQAGTTVRIEMAFATARERQLLA